MSEQPEEVQEVEAPETDEPVDTDELSEDQVWETVHGPELEDEEES